MDQAKIRNYNLFGEVGDFPDIVHCEMIETRSLLHDWEFPPHRHARLHQFLLIDRGSGTVEVDGATQELRDGSFINLPTGVVHAFRFRQETAGWVVTTGAEDLDEALNAREGIKAELDQVFIGQGNADIQRVIIRIFGEYQSRSYARAQILRALVAELAGLAARQIHASGTSAEGTSSALQRRFEALLEMHYSDHWQVTDYARCLTISTKQLSRVVRSATGMPASKLIEARLIREARRQLAYTNLSVSQVAYGLGFIDPAYFSRVFSRATGLSPRAFREKLDETR